MLAPLIRLRRANLKEGAGAAVNASIDEPLLSRSSRLYYLTWQKRAIYVTDCWFRLIPLLQMSRPSTLHRSCFAVTFHCAYG